MAYEPPIDHGPSSLLELQAIEIADLKAEVERLKAERDEADARCAAMQAASGMVSGSSTCTRQ
jgi:hypothetical protein